MLRKLKSFGEILRGWWTGKMKKEHFTLKQTDRQTLKLFELLLESKAVSDASVSKQSPASPHLSGRHEPRPVCDWSLVMRSLQTRDLGQDEWHSPNTDANSFPLFRGDSGSAPRSHHTHRGTMVRSVFQFNCLQPTLLAEGWCCCCCRIARNGSCDELYDHRDGTGMKINIGHTCKEHLWPAWSRVTCNV